MKKRLITIILCVFVAPVFAAVQHIPTAKISSQASKYSHIPTVGSVTVITAKQIKQMGANSLAEILRHYAALQIQDLYSDGSKVQLSMAGFGANSLSNLKVLINGIPMSNPDMGDLDLNQINTHNIQRIEILNASGAILYGDGAIAGVINIITKQPTTFAGHLGTTAGSYQQRGANADIMDSIGHWRYAVAGQKNHSNGFRDHNRNDQENLSAQVGYQTAKQLTIVHIQQNSDKERYPGPLTAQQFHNDPSQIGNSPGDYNQIDRSIELYSHFTLSQHWFLTNHMQTRRTTGFGEISAAGFDEKRYVHTLDPQIMAVYHTGLGNIISTTGIDMETDRFQLSATNSQDKRRIFAIYSQQILPIAKSVQLILGLRYAQAKNQLNSNKLVDTNKNQAFVSSVGLSWHITKELRWYLRRAGNYRFPKLDEADSIAANSQPLKAQKGVDYTTGLSWNWHKLVSTFEVYQLKLDNELAYDPTPVAGSPFGQTSNLPATKRNGLLLTENYQLTSAWQVGGQYAYIDGKFTQGVNSGKRIPLVAQNKISAFSQLDFAKHWSWFVESIYAGSRYPGGDLTNSQGEIGGSTIFNTNINYHIQHWTVALRLNNMTNKQYVESAYYSTSIGYYPAPGRNVLLNISYEF